MVIVAASINSFIYFLIKFGPFLDYLFSFNLMNTIVLSIFI